ncbi:MAG: enoyl-CoA hydratase/isomerase family protein [Candidatus Tectomicrobia bacterium]|uniref:Enoyl-CoA hydratase/isomerase family protein n=1 Tax=Tectimicrobiota bacterium TaxID=2528274 RepID=A0A933GMR9_UNCTE|nr:enoyl-CoA hydratase/isomerase family protein [Candidatus Tectomicrobia bacterium]
MTTEIVLIRKKDRVVTVILNRPESLNAFNAPMCQDLLKVLNKVSADESIRALVTWTRHWKLRPWYKQSWFQQKTMPRA